MEAEENIEQLETMLRFAKILAKRGRIIEVLTMKNELEIALQEMGQKTDDIELIKKIHELRQDMASIEESLYTTNAYSLFNRVKARVISEKIKEAPGLLDLAFYYAKKVALIKDNMY